MKEQKAESRLPNQKEVFVSRTTTFRELGIKDTREERLSLHIEPVTVFSIWDPRNRVRTFLGFFDHPFVGSHLAHFLNAGAPFQINYAYKDAILGDYIMPIAAQHPIQDDPVSREYVRLDNLHRGDPLVGPIYQDFVQYGLGQEDRALKNSKYGAIFDEQMILKFVSSKKTREGLIAARIHKGRLAYLNVVDLESQTTFEQIPDGVNLTFLDYNHVELSDNNGIKIQLEIQVDLEDIVPPYQVTKYTFPPEPLEDALYAVIGWENTDGKRRFISQKELLNYFPLPNIDQRKKPDTFLGRALLGYFSEHITRDWESEIPLKHGRGPQNMMAAQMVAWTSLDSKKYPHASQLLAGEVIQKLEEYALT